MTVLTGVLIGLCVGLMIGIFLDEILNWGRELYESWKPKIESAQLFIKKIGNKIVSYWRYLTNAGKRGTINRQEPHILTPPELEELKKKKPRVYEMLMTEDEVEIERYDYAE